MHLFLKAGDALKIKGISSEPKVKSVPKRSPTTGVSVPRRHSTNSNRNLTTLESFDEPYNKQKRRKSFESNCNRTPPSQTSIKSDTDTTQDPSPGSVRTQRSSKILANEKLKLMNIDNIDNNSSQENYTPHEESEIPISSHHPSVLHTDQQPNNSETGIMIVSYSGNSQRIFEQGYSNSICTEMQVNFVDFLFFLVGNLMGVAQDLLHYFYTRTQSFNIASHLIFTIKNNPFSAA